MQRWPNQAPMLLPDRSYQAMTVQWPRDTARILTAGAPFFTWGPFEIGDLIAVVGARQDGAGQSLYVEPSPTATQNLADPAITPNRIVVVGATSGGLGALTAFLTESDNDRFVTVRRVVASNTVVQVWRIANVYKAFDRRCP